VEEIDLERSGGVVEAVLGRGTQVRLSSRCVAQDPELAGERLQVAAADRAELGSGRGRGRNGTSPGSGSRGATERGERKEATRREAGRP